MLDISGFTEMLESSYWIWPAIAALIGLQIGSFINVLVGRLPQMMQ
ncbi:MAG: prepilin peptidase, partial [Betaproteobacteria bacterium]|nr:prepilin peptidase [Betaproteobacteria bacterium]